jgi:trimeric autotransporter adhesin
MPKDSISPFNTRIYSMAKKAIWLAAWSFLFSNALELAAQNPIPIQWSSTGGLAGPNNQVNVVLPDGAGNIYIGGKFTVVDQVRAPYLAKWNGTKWSAVGLPNSKIEEAPILIQSEVNALALGSDGSLYVGGYGMTLNGNTRRCLLKWDGTEWTDLSGPSLSASASTHFVDALSFWNGHLVVSGRFSQMGGTSASNIALWNGSEWSDLAGGMNGPVSSCLSYNGLLYAAGSFSQAGGMLVKNIARWNGSSWSAFGAECDGAVSHLALGDNGLLAAGAFREINNTVCNGIAKFDGTSWSAYGNGFGEIFQPIIGPTPGTANKVTVHDGKIYAIGARYIRESNGTVPRTNLVHGLHCWSGHNWELVSRGNLRNVATDEGKLYVCGGLIFDSTGSRTLAKNLIRWDGAAWKKIGRGLDNEESVPWVKAVSKLGADLYAAGSFNKIGDIDANSIARWDGNDWHPLGNGVNGNVESLAALGSDLFVAGNFTKAGGLDAPFIAKWDGSSWHSANQGVPGKASLLYVTETQLFAVSTKAFPMGDCYALLMWNGSAWSTLMHVDGPIESLLLQGDNLFIAGDFKTNWNGFDANSGGLFCYNLITRKLAPLGVTYRQGPISLIMHQGSLHASGLGIAGLTSGYACKWNGLGWSALGRGHAGVISSLRSINDDLIGLTRVDTFSNESGALRWNGISWASAEWKIHGNSYDMILDDKEVILCGNFHGVDSVISGGVITGTIPTKELPNLEVTEQPTSQTIAIGQRARMRISTNLGGVTYQWFQGTSGDASLPISNATSSNFITVTAHFKMCHLRSLESVPPWTVDF